jgi:hypothetical protein
MASWELPAIRDGPKLSASHISHFQGPSPNTFMTLLNRLRRRSRFNLSPPQFRHVIMIRRVLTRWGRLK